MHSHGPLAGHALHVSNAFSLHTAVFMGRSVNQAVMLADLDVLSADNYCRMAHARQYARQAAAATPAALYARNDPR